MGERATASGLYELVPLSTGVFALMWERGDHPQATIAKVQCSSGHLLKSVLLESIPVSSLEDRGQDEEVPDANHQNGLMS